MDSLFVRSAARLLAASCFAFTCVAGSAGAQPVDLPIQPATTDQFPAGVHILHLPTGAVYANDKGQVLYGMDMRTLLRFGSDPAQYCVAACAKTWAPMLAPPGSHPNIDYPPGYREHRQMPAGSGPPVAANATVPDWTIIAGPQGPQWVYKHWHVVFVRRGDRPGSTAFDGADGRTWNTLKYLPPAPKLAGPANVQALALRDSYVLADKDGRVLFTGACTQPCRWQPLKAGMASAAIGEWSVSTRGDSAQWLRGGKPVYISQEDDPKQVPAAGVALRP